MANQPIAGGGVSGADASTGLSGKMMGLLQDSSSEFPAGHPDFLGAGVRDFFDELFRVTGLERSQVIRDANIDRSYGYQLMNGTRAGKQDYYVALALAMGLDVKTTQRLLAVAGVGALYPLATRDAAIIHAIGHGWDNARLYSLLVQLGLAPLDTGVEPAAGQPPPTPPPRQPGTTNR
ncbi:MAG: hypothetical protein LBO20_02980 [Bifidobacteriaceae bacterium]|jgi:hypothetical protein|nr:hypothetical protein [Bifidobacteriaceae bacterium]